MRKKLFVVIGMLSLMLCACGETENELITENTGESVANQESIRASEPPSKEMETTESLQADKEEARDYASEQWYSAYQTILSDWKTIEQYGDFEYLKMYFDTGYQFDNYWLCDVNSDGTPELFLYSDYMNITAVFTYYENEIRGLMYDVIYGINKETEDIVVEGHWHGAGGSGVDEWSVYHITECEAVFTYYIDFYREYEELEIEEPYTVYDVTTGEYESQKDSEEYDKIFAAHVASCIKWNEYQRYALSDLSGLEVIQ